ncbi:MAG: hypothetical protein CMH57_11580 [Myxococcales bacterium]|nr:hypothetical protein [Myxococcales bacterium]
MSDKSRLEELSDEELLQELVRRRAARLEGDARQAESTLLEDGDELARQGLQSYLQQCSQNQSDKPRRCPNCGGLTPVKARNRTLTRLSSVGEVTYARHYYYCSLCKLGFYPLDDDLSLPSEGKLTAEMERRLLDLGANAPQEETAQRWSVHYSTSISTKLVRDTLERHGKMLVEESPHRIQARVAPRTSNTADVVYVETDGTTVNTREHGKREVKVGVIFDREHHLRGNRGRRGLITQARYVAHLDGLDGFDEQLKAALKMEAVEQAKQVVWLADGDRALWLQAKRLCPKALQILDWYHATEAASDCAQVLFDRATACREVFVETVATLLWDLGPERVIEELEQCMFVAKAAQQKEALRELHRYYSNNKERMQYKRYDEMGLMIGSGVIEASHRHVLHSRMRRAGQIWALDGAERMAKLRALYQTVGPADFYDVLRDAA